MARAIWKGVIRLDDAAIPVKLYSAVRDRTVHFRLLHDRDHVPLKQRMVDPQTGEVVDYADARRGYVTDDGALVVLEPEELESLQPEPSRDIEITRFVPPPEINHQWYDRPYYLGPDADVSAYAALAEALERRGLEGVARWTMRGKAYVGALRVERGYLMLMTLRHAGEVIPASALPRPGGRAPGQKELAMARQLLEALASDFDPADYRDEYRDRVLELIRARAAGETVRLEAPRQREAATGSLESLLRASVEGAREGRAA